MSWLYSQALVVEYLGENFLDGEQSAPLSGKPTQQAYCAPDKMTGFSRLSRFGMTYKPLTESRGQELLTLFREDFHAKTFQLQEMGMDWTESGQECGEKWHGLLARYDPDSHLWRTVQCSLLEDLNESLQTLPQWGMTVGGELYLLPTLVQSTNEKESGLSLVPTPTSSTGGANHNSPTTLAGKRYTMNLAGFVQLNPSREMWLTPTATSISGRSLEAMEYRKKYRESRGHKTVQPGNLAEQVMYSGDIPCKDMKKPTMWGTPKAQDSRHALRDRGKGNLGEQVSGLHNGGKLSPLWTEWLMGWPIGWTDLKPLEMDKSHFVQQQHGES